MVWHIVFGIEADIEALLSPTHLLLALGMLLMLSGGMRHFWATRPPGERRGFWAWFPFLLSSALSLAMILFLAQYGQFTELQATGAAPADPFYPQAVSVLGALVLSAAAVGMFAVMLQQERLPFGAITFIFVLVIAAHSLMREGTEAIPAALLAGVLGDVWLHLTETRLKRITGLRVFCFIIPFAYYLALMGLMPLRYGALWWAVHMTAGLPVVTGLAGILISFVAWPPKQSVERTG